MSLPQLPHRGSKKSHGKISWPNPIGKHIQVLQQNPSNTGHESAQLARPLWATNRYHLGLTDKTADPREGEVAMVPMLVSRADGHRSCGRRFCSDRQSLLEISLALMIARNATKIP